MIVTPMSEQGAPNQMVNPAERAAILPPGVVIPFILVTGLFLLWGIPNALNDVLIRQFMKSFEISRLQGGLVQSAFYMGYFLLALPAGLMMKKLGYKSGFLTGLCLFATGCFLFLPAAHSGKYGFFLAALFIVASGLAFLETASNPFVAQLGPKATSEIRLNIAQAFNPLGLNIGVLAGTLFIFSGVEKSATEVATMQAAGTYHGYLQSEILRTVTPYLVIGSAALLWAIMIGLTKFPAFLQEKEHEAEVSGNWRDLLHKPHFMLAVCAQFLYCGSQTCMWSYLITYAKENAHLPERTAGYLLTANMIIFLVGRFGSAALMRHFAASKMMTVYGIINACLMLVAVTMPNWVGLCAILSGAFFLSLMFPTIFALGLKDLGANTKLAGSIIVMAIVGGAVMAPMAGGIADAFHNTAMAYLLPLVGNLGIAAYAVYMTKYNARRALISDQTAI